MYYSKTPYVKFMKEGKFYDVNGKVLPNGNVSRSHIQIIPLSDDERTARIQEIEQLDSQGLEFAKRLKDLVIGGAKVKYYSEGKLKYLHVD